MSNKAYYQKKIEDLRAKIQKEKDAMKRDNEFYARLVKNATTPGTKATHKKSKIDKSERHKRNIESLKQQLAQARLSKTKASK